MLERWISDRLRIAADEAIDKVRQFSLETIADAPPDGFTALREGFARVGVWALQNPEPVFQAVQSGVPFTVLIGMRPGAGFHLGHLTLMRELCWLIRCGGQPIFVFAGYEAERRLTPEEARRLLMRFGETYQRFTGDSLPESVACFSDQDSWELRDLEVRVAKHLSVRKILQLYGWSEDTPLGTLRVPAMMASAFLLGSTLFPARPTLALSDILQVTHAEVTKIVAKRLGLSFPSYSYRLLLPSLEGPTQRMSIKNPKSLIVLGENQKGVRHKLQRCFSGGCLTPEEQRRDGGNPQRCSFFKIATALQPPDEITRMHQRCVTGAVLCGECKTTCIPALVDKIHEISS